MRTWMSVRFFSGTLVVLASVALAGCGGSGATSSTGATSKSAASVPSTSSTTSTTSTSTASTTTSSTSTSSTPPTTTKTVQVAVSGTPATTVIAGQAYAFTPSATVSSGTPAFSIQNAPTWATFNTSTGALSGTPTTADVGTYSNITITAAAGGSSASLQPFAITVAAPSAPPGGVVVSWVPPTTATDGSTLTDLAGYDIYYGSSPSALTQEVQVTNIGVTDYVITGLTSGTWYFVVTSYTTNGTQSVPSNLVSVSVS